MGCSKGLHIKCITIIPTKNSKGEILKWGYTCWEEANPASKVPCSVAEKEIFKSFAGPIAEQLFTGETTEPLFTKDRKIDFYVSQKNKDYRVAVSYVPCDMQPGKEAEPYIRPCLVNTVARMSIVVHTSD